MPTDLPPDYKPRPKDDPAEPADPNVPGAVPAFPPVGGDDAVDPAPGPRPGSDVVDPPGWGAPPAAPGGDSQGDPLPAGMPVF